MYCLSFSMQVKAQPEVHSLEHRGLEDRVVFSGPCGAALLPAHPGQQHLYPWQLHRPKGQICEALQTEGLNNENCLNFA